LFSGFVTWTADILTARGVSAATLFPTLDLVGKQRWQQHPPSPTRRVRRPTPN
jgi:3-methyladenine DNA glycosylase/8-oxoguanine DNA glycosylase